MELRLHRYFYDLSLTFDDYDLSLCRLIVIQDLNRYNRAVLFKAEIPHLLDVDVELSESRLLLHSVRLVFIGLDNLLFFPLGTLFLKFKKLQVILPGYFFIGLSSLKAELDVNCADMLSESVALLHPRRDHSLCCWLLNLLSLRFLLRILLSDSRRWCDGARDWFLAYLDGLFQGNAGLVLITFGHEELNHAYLSRDWVAVKLDSQVCTDQIVKGLLVHFKVIQSRVVVSKLIERDHIIVV